MNIQNKFVNCISSNNKVQKILSKTADNPSVATGLVAFTTSSILKPTTTLLLPTSKEDKRYSATESMINGVVDLIFSVSIFVPISKITDITGKQLKKLKGSIYNTNPKSLEALNVKYNRILRILLLGVKIGVSVAILPVVKNLIFGKSDKKK